MKARRLVMTILATATVAVTSMGAAWAGSPVPIPDPAPVVSEEVSTFMGPDGKERSVGESVESGSPGMILDLAEGDRVVISDGGQMATWVTASGVELIEFDNPKSDGDSGVFYFEDGTLSVVSIQIDNDAASRSCWQSKAVEFGWNVLWSGLVCVPVGVASAGVGGFVCSAAGAGISVFVPWDEVCG